MNGKNHERLLNFLFYIVIIFLLYTRAYWLYIILFGVLWKIGTYRWTPDRDTHSRSTKKAGLSGKIIDKIFKHHGILHSFWMWLVVGLAGYYYIGWWTLGLVIPQEIHIGADGVSHRWKIYKFQIVMGALIGVGCIIIIEYLRS